MKLTRLNVLFLGGLLTALSGQPAILAASVICIFWSRAIGRGRQARPTVIGTELAGPAEVGNITSDKAGAPPTEALQVPSRETDEPSGGDDGAPSPNEGDGHNEPEVWR